MNKLIKKAAIVSALAVSMLGSTLVAHGGMQSGWILEYVYKSGSTVVGEQVINQCTGAVFSSGDLTGTKVLVSSEPCGYSL